MHFVVSKDIGKLIAQLMADGEFDSPTSVVEFSLFVQQKILRPYYECRAIVDAELARGAKSGPGQALENPSKLTSTPLMRVIATPAAKSDLVHIWSDCHSRSSKEQAERYIVLLSSQLIVLSDFPNLGCLWRGDHVGVRVLLLGEYGIFYYPVPDGIEILRILPSTMHNSPVQ
jgi:toxin ParE1/3/4